MELSKRAETWFVKLKKTSLKYETVKFINGESVEVGYRSTCGCTDQTMKDFEVFFKFVKALNAQGIFVKKTRAKHKNEYASNNGGFWDSYIFKIGE